MSTRTPAEAAAPRRVVSPHAVQPRGVKRAVSDYPLMQFALAFAIGILMSTFVIGSLAAFLVCAALFTVATVTSLLKNRSGLATAAVLLVAFSLGGAFALIEKNRIPSNQIRRLLEDGAIKIDEPVELTGVLDEEPELAPERLFLRVRVESISAHDAVMQASGEVMLLARPSPKNDSEFRARDLHYGARIRVLTKLERSDSYRNPGVSSFTEYLDARGYDATALVKSPLLIERLDNERVFLPLAWLYRWRRSLLDSINSHFSNETAGVLDAALLGNRYFLSQSSSERFRDGGTFHVLVISGLHITFLGGLIFIIARRFTRNRTIQFVLSVIGLWSFTLAVGAQASVVRAALMFTLVILAPLLSRQASSLNALGGSALLLIAQRPADLLDPSFQLTFASVAAIVLLAWPLLEKLTAVGAWRPTRETPYPPSCPGWLRSFCETLFWSERRWKVELEQANYSCKLLKAPAAKTLERFHLQRPLRFAFSTIVVSASVQLVLLPLLILYFHRLSLAAIVLNIGVSLTMVALTAVALLSLLVAQISATLAAPLIGLTNQLNWLMVHSVDPFARAGLASIRLPEYSGWAAIVYAFYYVPLALLIGLLWRWRPLSLSTLRTRRRFAFDTALLLQAVFVGVVILHPWSARRPDGKLHLDFLDVGQGDSALVTMPDGSTLLVDGGGKPGPFRQDQDDVGEEKFERDTRSIGEAVVSEFLWQRGLDRVDYILATHADADHIDGLNDIVRNFQVRAGFVGRTPGNDPEFQRFAQTMSFERIPVQLIDGGDKLQIGGVSLNVLWPPAAQNSSLPSQNDDSVVLQVVFGSQTFLLTGDIEARAEGLLARSIEKLEADVVKVAHHGSKTSSTDAFVAATGPRYAVISVGQTSIFGHPNPGVVRKWQDAGAEVLRTGACGTITFTTDGNVLTVETFVKQK